MFATKGSLLHNISLKKIVSLFDKSPDMSSVFRWSPFARRPKYHPLLLLTSTHT